MIEKIRIRNVDIEDFEKYFRSATAKITKEDLDQHLITDIKNSNAGQYDDTILLQLVNEKIDKSEAINLFAKKEDLILPGTKENFKDAIINNKNNISANLTSINSIKTDLANNYVKKNDLIIDGKDIKEKILSLNDEINTKITNGNNVISKNMLSQEIKNELISKLTADSETITNINNNINNNENNITKIIDFLSAINFKTNATTNVIIEYDNLPEDLRQFSSKIELLENKINALENNGAGGTGTGTSTPGGSSQQYENLINKVYNSLFNDENNTGNTFFILCEYDENDNVIESKIISDTIYKSEALIIRDKNIVDTNEVKKLAQQYMYLLYINAEDENDDPEIYVFYNAKWVALSEIQSTYDSMSNDEQNLLSDFNNLSFSNFEGRLVKEYNTNDLYFVSTETEKDLRLNTVTIKDLNTKADKLTVYTKTEIDNMFNNRLSTLKTEIENEITQASDTILKSIENKLTEFETALVTKYGLVEVKKV